MGREQHCPTHAPATITAQAGHEANLPTDRFTDFKNFGAY